MTRYEYIEITGDCRESGMYNYPVSADNINEYAKDGWRFVEFRYGGATCLMEREVEELRNLKSENLVKLEPKQSNRYPLDYDDYSS